MPSAVGSTVDGSGNTAQDHGWAVLCSPDVRAMFAPLRSRSSASHLVVGFTLHRHTDDGHTLAAFASLGGFVPSDEWMVTKHFPHRSSQGSGAFAVDDLQPLQSGAVGVVEKLFHGG